MAKLTTQDALKLALDHHKAGNFAAAEQIYRKILVRDANNPDALHLLGFLLRQTGRVRTGIDLLERAVSANPAVAQFHNHLGMAMRDLGRPDEAADEFRTAIQLNPSYPEAHNNLGLAMHDVRQLPQAVASFRKAVALDPNYPDPHSNMGSALLDIGRVDEAAGECRAAIRLNQNFADAYNNLGKALCEQGLVDEAIEQYRTAAQLAPYFQDAWSNYLFSLHLSARWSGAAILDEHRNWANQCAQPLAQSIQPHTNERSPDRMLKIGYVSRDFHDCSLGRFLLPLLAQHDRERYEAICFADGATVDDHTHRLKSHAKAWHVTSSLNDSELADLVRHERIDVLVDLRVHLSPNRLLAFARKPAPVQITYLGYPGTTGLGTMDYRLTDQYLDPPSDPAGAEALYTEESLKLSGPYWCYEPHHAAPDVGPLPATRKGFVTFGCLSSFARMSGAALDLWRQMLATVPDSLLLLHALAGAHRDRLRNTLSQAGIDPNRVDFIGKSSLLEWLRAYERIDIALDPFPFNGGMTTCDALWMGVPVITLAGLGSQSAVQRQGASVLNHAKLAQFIARTPQEFLEIAARLASNLDHLAQLRSSLRQKIAASPLMDAAGYARGVEEAYRQAWRRWCEKKR